MLRSASLRPLGLVQRRLQARHFCKSEVAPKPDEVTPKPSEVAPTPAPSERVPKPVLFGGVALAGALAVGVLLKQDGILQHVQPTLSKVPDPTKTYLRDIGSLFKAYILATVPADELKAALLRQDALGYWSYIMQAEAVGQEAIALGAMRELLTGVDSRELFHPSPDLYWSVVTALLSLLEPRKLLGCCCVFPKEFRDKHLSELLVLGVALVTHPSFSVNEDLGDERFWTALLEAGVADELKAEEALAWSYIASAAVRHRPALARSVLLDRPIKSQLLRLAEADADNSAHIYARAALRDLAAAAEREGAPDLEVVRDKPFADFWDPAPQAPPAAVLPEALQDVLQETTPLETVLFCALGGLIWGTLRGLRQRQRAVRAIWQTALLTTAGSCGFQAAMEAKAHIGKTLSGSSNLNYSSINSCLLGLTADSAASLGVLWALLALSPARFSFGGWVLGHLACTTALLSSGSL